MKEVEIFTDGACSGNPGPGGWGAILRYKSTEKELSGFESKTTNNRMELTALIKALEMLKVPCKVKAFSDSKYLCDSILLGWAEKWQKNNWIKSNKKAAINIDLWGKLLKLLKIHDVNLVWVKGHAGHPENERCDKLATSEIEKHKNLN